MLAYFYQRNHQRPNTIWVVYFENQNGETPRWGGTTEVIGTIAEEGPQGGSRGGGSTGVRMQGSRACDDDDTNGKADLLKVVVGVYEWPNLRGISAMHLPKQINNRQKRANTEDVSI